jgi:hypothetical protein
MPDLMMDRLPDRPLSSKEIAQELCRLHGGRGVLADTTRDRMACTFIVALCDQDDQLAANIFDGEVAEREWHQRDHVLTGFSMRPTLNESHAQALACARRGKLERYGLTVWFDRGDFPDFVPRYRIFRRARRRPPHYRPQGPELTRDELAQLLPRSS